MTRAVIETLLERIAAAAELDADLSTAAVAALREVFPKAPRGHENSDVSVEAVLHLIDVCLPHWTIKLKGKAERPDGHWRCSLRESTVSDEDEVLGVGQGPTVGLTLLMALLRVALQKSP